MATLRITQTTESTGQYRAEVALEGDGLPRQTATASFPFAMTEQDQKDLRWYLEDYLQFPHEPAPKVAARVEQRIADIGTELFKAVFQSSEAARDLWSTLRTNLNDMRVEIIAEVREAASIPWELIRDPGTDRPLALHAQAFVRAHPQAAQRPRPVDTGGGTIRILLVICRPGASDDVPFRSVASRLIKGLGDEARALFQLDVLRPPTFEQLGRVLRRAKNENKPYHVVHFDGHGVYLDAEDEHAPGQILRNLMPVLLSGPRTGSHGYLVFENPDLEDNTTLVDGPAMGNLLVETNVPVLVLNACRSAHAEAPDDAQPVDQPAQASPSPVRAFGSLAQEVMDAGVAGVVAMRYNVYVVTAAQFVAELYATLAQGRTLGQAVTLGRKGLADKPMREIAYDPLPLQDWSVPVVFEAAPIALFPEVADNPTLTVNIHAAGASAEVGSLDTKLPKPPDAGFFGRDETLLALDRAFDTQSIVLLHAYAGSGKTTTAAEFARWYALTGGIQGPVLFTSFEQYLPLARVLDRIGDVFGPSLEQAGTNWLTLDDEQRREVALQVLCQRPVLWIWDNVEPVSGFPIGTASAWSDEEQRELADFLRDARQTRAKFLLISRRHEREWPGDTLPRRIQVPPMPMQERVQLARAIAERHNRRLTEVDDWRPLLRFTDGNPLTLTVLVGQALRDGLKTKAQIEAFVADLRVGEAKFTDEASEGRARSLGASLSYGFEHTFSQDERGALALLYFFQGFVKVDVLRTMGDPKADWCVPAVRGLTRGAGMALLDRAAEVGLLTSHGDGYYAIHPALPWFFKSLFDEHYREGEAPDIPNSALRTSHLQATRAFVEAMGLLGDYYHNQYEGGNRDVIAALSTEEANLLHIRRLARTHSWWHRVTSAMQGLDTLFEHSGRRAEWSRLVDEIVPAFVDLSANGSLPGREDQWSLVTDYRVRLAMGARQWTEAENLQRTCVDRSRQTAEEVVGSHSESAALVDWLETTAPNLNAAQRNAVRTLAASLHKLGQIGCKLQNADCVAALEEAIALFERIGARAEAATCAMSIGDTYKEISSIRSLVEAEHWFRRSLKMCPKHDRQGRAISLTRLGEVAMLHFTEACDADRPEVVRHHVNTALQSYCQALQEFSQTDVQGQAVTHNALGEIYRHVGDVARALAHFRKSIRYDEGAGNLYNAAGTRFNVALTFADSGRPADALEYARAALRNYKTYGDGATQDLEETQQLITQIEQQAQDG
jgi:tetratricopeptide (TPR) repeat protein